MIKPESTHISFPGLLIASPQFWFCNIAAWAAYGMAQALRDSFGGSPLLINLIKVTPTAVLGVLAGLCVHMIYTKRHWHNRHPIRLIPMAGLIALTFAVINLFVNSFDLVMAIPEICSREYPRPPFSCGAVSDQFLQGLTVMLVWCLFYFLIQAERKSRSDLTCSGVDILIAALVLFALNGLGNPLTVIAYIEWGDTYYLFSKAYFLDALRDIPFALAFASFIIFIKPGEQYWASRILPLVPVIIIMSLCFAVLSLGVEAAFSRLYNTEIRADLPISNYVYYVLFGESYGGFGTAGALAGVLQGEMTTTLLAVLFFIACTFSTHWKNSDSQATSVNNLSKSIALWGCNLLYWLSFGLLIYATDLMDLTSFGPSVPFTNAISFAISGVFAGALLRLQIKYFAGLQDTPAMLVAKIFFVSWLMAFLLTSSMWMASYAYIFVLLDARDLSHYSNFVNYGSYVFASILVSFILCGLWAFICYMIEAQKLQRNAVINQLLTERNLKEIQLNTLAGKIDPHFVFNALNNIRALIDEDSEKARSAIVVLSDILRSPITNNVQSKTPLADELLLIRNYIALSKIQYEDCLDYEETISAEAEDALLPAMILQILVENAIKHGISQLPDGGVLSLDIHKHEQRLVCRIINDGTLKVSPTTSGFGIGINAVQERLRLLYPNQASFNLYQLDNRVVAEVSLPFEVCL